MQKGYYAVIPESVLHDKELSSQAKIIYGEISALCAKEGYCWASNSYFAEIYDVATRSIIRWIKDLEKKGYIVIEMENGNRRKIRTAAGYKKKSIDVPVGVTNVSQGGDRNVMGGMTNLSWGYDKNVTPPKPETTWESKAEWQNFSPNNITNNINNNINNNTPYIPQRGNGDDVLEKQFDEWWASYPKKVGKKPTWNKYQKIHPDESLHRKMMDALAKQKDSSSWKRGYVPNPLTWINQERWEDEIESKHESKNPFDEYLESECL